MTMQFAFTVIGMITAAAIGFALVGVLVLLAVAYCPLPKLHWGRPKHDLELHTVADGRDLAEVSRVRWWLGVSVRNSPRWYVGVIRFEFARKRDG